MYFSIFTKKKTIKNSLYILIIFFVFSINLYAKADNILYTQIIDENKIEISDKKLIENINKFQQDLDNSQRKDVQIICNVLLANLYAKESTDVNKKCNILYADALSLVKQSNNIGLQIWVESQIGFYFYKFYKYDEASDYFFNVSRLLKEVPIENIVDPISVFKYNAYFFSSIDEKQASNLYLKHALSLTPKTDKDYATFLNAMGCNYFCLKKYDLANQYFNETILYSRQNNDSLRLAKGLGDLAQIFILKKQFRQAERLLLDDIQISRQVNNPKNAMFAQIRLGKMYVEDKKFNQAKEVFDSALSYIITQDKFKSFEFDVNNALLSIAIFEKNTADELLLRRQLDFLKPIVDTIDGAEILKKISWKNQNEIANWKFESEQIKLEKASFMKTTFIIISGLLLCLLILFVFIYKRRLKLQQVNYENSILSAQLKQFQIEKALNEANDSLKSIKTYLIGKNRLIVKLESQIKDLASKSNGSQEKHELDKLISSHLMTDENWLTFKQSFINEQPEIFNFIKENFTDLSESNLRIVLLHKIGLKNQEIANLLGITIHGVKKAKQRLRLKYGQSIEDLV